MPKFSDQTTINIRKFKEWVFCTVSEDSLLYQIIQKEKDDMTLEEALAKTGLIFALIDNSANFATLKKKKGREKSRGPRG